MNNNQILLLKYSFFFFFCFGSITRKLILLRMWHLTAQMLCFGMFSDCESQSHQVTQSYWNIAMAFYICIIMTFPWVRVLILLNIWIDCHSNMVMDNFKMTWNEYQIENVCNSISYKKKISQIQITNSNNVKSKYPKNLM